MRRTVAGAVLAAVMVMAAGATEAGGRTGDEPGRWRLMPGLEVPLALSWAPGDTVRVVARWAAAPASDVAYATRWAAAPARAGFPVTKGQRTGLADTVFLAAPESMSDSVRVDFAVWSVRIATGRASRDTSRAARWFRRADVAPPGPGPAGIDTSAIALQADSVAVLLADDAITVGDSTVACAVVRVAGRWRLGAPAGTIRSSQTSATMGRLLLFEAPVDGTCSALATARFGGAFPPGDAWSGIRWSSDTVVVFNSGGDPGDGSWARGPLLSRQELFRARAGRASAKASLRAH